jgi:hypothetical protein
VTDIETQLLAALTELESGARTRTEPRPSLLPLFDRIEALAQALGPSGDAELRHFLQRKSYEKARQRLQGLETSRGRCGH